MRNHKGQSITEVAVGLGLIAVVGFALMALLSPKGEASPAMRDLIAGTDLDSEVGTDTDIDTLEYPEVIDYSMSHAANHAEYIEAQNCLSKYGPAQTWKKPWMNRKAAICYEGPRFYIQILEKRGGVWYEVTKFLRGSARSLGDAGTYLKNSGYGR